MTEPTTISVRGVAHQVVPPDFAVLHLSIQSQERGKHQVLERAARAARVRCSTRCVRAAG